ncbi:ketoacyl-synthetase C-terminal extension domain-containing protein [Micromonospora tarensis]|uniref:Polyketide synthase C-terminal extension domain-containing protein n=1 Tax=Micromonospora tarensis TaxID=2806100 RepID=A0ABS1YF19_9ACTN|nr:ketoacyl-synthetase C-terminal extension domain-containing protein [Micromonospora tarensis]MBM0276019.1 hypothetical protein [Micromonospora tarensis]
MIGLIKTVLALTHRTIPPIAHLRTPNPAIRLDGSVFELPSTARPWASVDGVRRAGVSAFGIGGTNAHVVLEQAPPTRPRPRRHVPQLLLVSAKTAAVAQDSLDRVTAFAAETAPGELADLAYTLRTGRAELQWRAALLTLAHGEATGVRRVDEAARARGVALHLTGAGELTGNRPNYDADPVYRRTVDEGVALLRGHHLGDGVRERCDRLLACVGLTRSLISRGVTPRALAGSGVGVLAGAVVAAVMSLAYALALLRGADAPDVRLNPAELPLHVDGRPDDHAYWRAQAARPAASVPLPDEPDRVLWVEVGTSVTPHLGADQPPLPADRHARVLATVGALWQSGLTDGWDPVHDTGRRRLPAPTYPFAATRHYLDAPGANPNRER